MIANIIIFVLLCLVFVYVLALFWVQLPATRPGFDIGDSAKSDIDNMTGTDSNNYYELDELLKDSDNLEKEVLTSMYKRGIKIKK